MISVVGFLMVITVLVWTRMYLNKRYPNKEKGRNSHVSAFPADFHQKPKIWVYLDNFWNSRQWESFHSRMSLLNLEPHLLLALDSIIRYNQPQFNVIVLYPSNVRKYLPKLDINLGAFSLIPQQQQRDYLQWCILYQYGGIWLPATSIVFRSLLPLSQLLEQYHLVGVGCPAEMEGESYRYLFPDTQVMISRPGVGVLRHCIGEFKKYYNQHRGAAYNYNQFARQVFWKQLTRSCQYGDSDFRYHQLPASYDGTRNDQRQIVRISDLLSSQIGAFENPDHLHLVVYSREDIQRQLNFKWFERYSVLQIINSNLFIGHLFRAALGLPSSFKQIATPAHSTGPVTYLSVSPVDQDRVQHVLSY